MSGAITVDSGYMLTLIRIRTIGQKYEQLQKTQGCKPTVEKS